MRKSSPLVTVIVLSHEDLDRTGEFINELQKQTYKNFEVIVMHADNGGAKGLVFERGMPYFDLKYYITPDFNDWGQMNCSLGLFIAEGKYTCFMNNDDKYEPTYIEEMVDELEKGEVKFVACDYISKEGATILGTHVLNVTTRGSYMFDTELGNKVGYNHRDYGADGKFAEEMISAGSGFARVPKVLFYHQ